MPPDPSEHASQGRVLGAWSNERDESSPSAREDRSSWCRCSPWPCSQGSSSFGRTPPAAPHPRALRGSGPFRLELTVVDDLGRSPGISAFCVQDARGTTTFGKTDDKGKAVVELSGEPRADGYPVFAGRLDAGRTLYWARDRIPGEEGTPAAFTVTYGRLSQIDGVVNDADGQDRKS